MGELAPRPCRHGQAVGRRQREGALGIVQRRRDINIEAQIGKATEQ